MCLSSTPWACVGLRADACSQRERVRARGLSHGIVAFGDIQRHGVREGRARRIRIERLIALEARSRVVIDSLREGHCRSGSTVHTGAPNNGVRFEEDAVEGDARRHVPVVRGLLSARGGIVDPGEANDKGARSAAAIAEAVASRRHLRWAVQQSPWLDLCRPLPARAAVKKAARNCASSDSRKRCLVAEVTFSSSR